MLFLLAVGAMMALVALMAPTTNAQGLASCPVDPTSAELNFATIPVACATPNGATDAFCNTCLCGLVDVYMPAFEAAGLVDDIAAGGSVPIDATSDLIQVCSNVFLGPLLQSGVDLTGLMNLPDCNFDDANVPPCVEEKFRAQAALRSTTPGVATPSLPVDTPLAPDDESNGDSTPPADGSLGETILPDDDLDFDVVEAVENQEEDGPEVPLSGQDDGPEENPAASPESESGIDGEDLSPTTTPPEPTGAPSFEVVPPISGGETPVPAGGAGPIAEVPESGTSIPTDEGAEDADSVEDTANPEELAPEQGAEAPPRETLLPSAPPPDVQASQGQVDVPAAPQAPHPGSAAGLTAVPALLLHVASALVSVVLLTGFLLA